MLGFWGMQGRDADARGKEFAEDNGILQKIMGFWDAGKSGQGAVVWAQCKDLGKIVGFWEGCGILGCRAGMPLLGARILGRCWDFVVDAGVLGCGAGMATLGARILGKTLGFWDAGQGCLGLGQGSGLGARIWGRFGVPVALSPCRSCWR